MLVKTNTTKENSLGSDFESMCISSDSASVLLAYLITCIFLYVLLTFYPKKVASDFTWSYLPTMVQKAAPGTSSVHQGAPCRASKGKESGHRPHAGTKTLGEISKIRITKVCKENRDLWMPRGKEGPADFGAGARVGGRS